MKPIEAHTNERAVGLRFLLEGARRPLMAVSSSAAFFATSAAFRAAVAACRAATAAFFFSSTSSEMAPILCASTISESVISGQYSSHI